MRKLLRDARGFVERLWRIIVLFVILRLVAGLALVVLGGGIAPRLDVTLICAAAAVGVYVMVALAVRRWSPPRRA